MDHSGGVQICALAHSGPAAWTQPGWFDVARAWIDTELARLGFRLSGQIEQPHIRPWSTVLRVPTNIGVLYFKATSPATSYEPTLTQALARWRPDCTPDVLATELERGWLLMRSSGVMLRTLIDSPGAAERHWERALPLYAELQIELAGRTHELQALGVPDRRLAALPAAFDTLLADTDLLRVGLTDGLDQSELERLHELKPRILRQCERVSELGVPESLHHDDFHDGNVFFQDGRYVFADWAESAVAHPFFSLVVALRSIAYRTEVSEDDPLISRLRDCYLEPWQRYASRAELLELAERTRPLGAFCRALTWAVAVSCLDGTEREEYADAVPGWLGELLVLKALLDA